MSGQETPQALARENSEQAVVEYLRRHPDFLARHPQLVQALQVPHDCAPAASLIEYQVASLKAQCEQLRGRLLSLVENARSNEELARRLHRLVLGLVESPGLDELFTSLYQGLEEGFGADLVALRVFADPREGADRGLAELAGAHADHGPLRTVLVAGQPQCGKPEADVLAALFGDRAARVGSAALVPLAISDRAGVLAIGSHNATRFHPSMGTLYLRQLGDVLSRLLARRVC